MLHPRGGELERISDTLPAYDPLHFPLPFPHGERGRHLAGLYQCDVPSHSRNRISCREFCRIHTVPQGQYVLTAASRSKIIYAPIFQHTTEMRLPSLPGSPGTTRLVLIFSNRFVVRIRWCPLSVPVVVRWRNDAPFLSVENTHVFWGTQEIRMIMC